MIEGVIALIIALVILGVVYFAFKWVVSAAGFGGPTLQIGNLVFGAVALILVLKYLVKLL